MANVSEDNDYQPPRVILAPSAPPKLSVWAVFVIAGICIMAMAYGVALWAGNWSGLRFYHVAPLAMSAFSFAIMIRTAFAQHRIRARSLQCIRLCGDAGPLESYWTDASKPVELDDTFAALEQVDEWRPGQPAVVVFGAEEPPASVDDHFELEILGPWDLTFSRSQWIWLTLGVLFVALVVAAQPPVLWLRLGVGGIALGAGVAVLWRKLWHVFITPRYYRFAPRVIQGIDFPPWGNAQPRIRTYSMEADTRVLIVHVPGATRVELASGDQRDTFRVFNSPRGKQLINTMWQAILSSAPTPPLSETELTG